MTPTTDIKAITTKTASTVQENRNLGTFIFQKGGFGSVVFVTKLIVLLSTVSN